MRLTSILPSLGMMVISFSAFASGGNGLHSLSSWTNRAAFLSPFLSEKNELLMPAVMVNSITNPSCYDVNTGSIQVTASGFAGSGAFTWNIQGTNHLGGAVNQTFVSSLNPFTFPGLKAGTYTVKATRGLEMATSLGHIVKHPPGPMTPSATTDPTICFGNSDGSITLVGTFPAPGTYGDMNLINEVTYTLTSGPGTPITYTDFGTPFSSPISNPFNGLAAGTYSGTIKLNNCTVASIVNITVAQPTAVTLTTATSTQANCFDQPSGTVTVAAATGGTGAKQYRLFGTNYAGAAVNKPYQTSTIFTGLKASMGNYSIQARDINLCVSNIIFVAVGQPTQLTFSPGQVVNHVTCNAGSDGKASFPISGGTPPYTVNLGGGHTATGASPVMVSGLPAGMFTAAITDANGCVPVGNPTVTITQPTPILPTSTQVNVSCFNGNNGLINLSVSGGNSGGYTYQWSNGPTTQDISGLTAGPYSVTITDSKFCTQTYSVTITQPTQLSGTTTFTQPLCNGGSTGTATVSATGGTPAVGVYQVNIGAGNVSTNGSGMHTFTGLAAGNYTITITDNNNCTATTSVTITEPTPVAVTNVTAVGETCDYSNDGSLSGTIGGGTPNYSIQISGPSYNLTVPNYPAGSFASGPILQGGTYSFTVTDANSCSTTGSKTVAEPATLVISSADGTDPLCNGGSDGFIEMEVAGGTPGYSYNYGQGAVSFSGNSTTIEDLAAGTYNITVTDSRGCISAVSTVMLGEPTAIVFEKYLTAPGDFDQDGQINVSCHSGSDAVAFFDISGGSPDYPTDIFRNNVFQFSFVADANPMTYWLLQNIDAATWRLDLTDQHGCPASLTFNITEPDTIEVVNIIIENETCDYNDDGFIQFEIQGGTEPYDIELYGPGGLYGTATDYPANSPVFTSHDLEAGAWHAVITDENGCVFEADFLVTEPPTLVLTIDNETDPSCYASTNGSISASAIGGTGDYLFELNGTEFDAGLVSISNSTGNFTGLQAGVYSVTVYDENSCANSVLNITLNHPDELFIDSYLFEGIQCYGQYQGYGDAIPVGGTGPYDFVLLSSPFDVNGFYVAQGYLYPPAAAPGHMFNDLTNGNYLLSVEDEHGCFAFINVAIDDPAQLQLTEDLMQHTDNSCFGYSDGTFYVVGSGGLAPYDFYLNGDYFSTGTETGAGGLEAGIYTMEITDANGCESGAITVEITEPAEWSVDLTATPASCFGSSNGQIAVHINESFDNTGDYYAEVYEWDGLFFNSTGLFLDNQTADFTFSGLPAGDYSVLVSDNGTFCILLPDETNLVTITEPALLVAASTATPILCNGGSATVTVSATGGTAPYSGTGQFSRSAGTWTFTVTDSHECTATTTITISQPAALVASSSATAILCNGGSATVTVSATGGTGSISGTGPFTRTAGTHVFTVTDANGCTATTSITISQPAVLVATSSAMPVLCFGGSSTVTVSASGGTAPYSGTGTFSRPAGTHTFTVTDNNGCTATTSITITQPANPLEFADIDITEPQCNGGFDGTVFLEGMGGTAPYFFSQDGIDFYPDQLFYGYPAGIFDVYIRDANGCDFNTEVTVGEPTVIVATADVPAHSCNGGELTILVSGGTGPYLVKRVDCNDFNIVLETVVDVVNEHTFTNLGDNASFCFLVTDDNECGPTPLNVFIPDGQISDPIDYDLTVTNVGCFGNATGSISITNTTGGSGLFNFYNGDTQFLPAPGTAATFTGLVAGEYTIVIEDADYPAYACLLEFQVTITEPTAALSASSTATAILCNGGNSTVTVSATGGTAGYTGTGQFTRPAGTHSFTVTDANGCTATTSITITEPAALVASSAATAILCNGGNSTVTVSATGGTGAISGTGQFSRTAGTWNFTVTDANGCTATTSITITEPAALVASSSATAILCNGGNSTVTVSATGGTGAISGTGQFSRTAGTWNFTVTDANGCTATTSITITEPAALVASSSATAILCNGGNSTVTVSATGGTGAISGTGQFSRTAGTWNFTVTDANGCTATTSITITEPAALVASSSATAILCNGGNSTVTVSATGGTGAISGTGQFSRTAGTHTFTVTDANGCTATTSITITEPAALVASSSATAILCNGGNSTVTVSATGGTGAISGTGQFSRTAGTWNFTVTDANGCTATTSITITEPTQLGATVSSAGINCVSNTGCITVAPTGGVPAWSIQLSGPNGSGGQGAVSQMGGSVQICNLPPGIFSIVVTDANGCSFTTSFVLAGGPPTLSTTQTNLLCMGASNGSIDLTVTGGVPAYSYNWSNGASTQDLQNLVAGTYTVIVTDANGCSATTSATITEPSMISLQAATTPAACGAQNGTVTLTVSGGSPGYTFAWGNGATTQNLANLAGGSYTVVVTDANGCTKLATAIVLQTPAPTVSATTTAVACFGQMTGSILASATGGTMPYQFRLNGGAYQNSGSFAGLAAGSYTVEVQDGNGCTGTTTATITQPQAALSATTASTNALCFGQSNGTITVTAAGGTAGYQYKLGNGAYQNNHIFGGLAAGTYVLSVRDANGCERSVQATVNQPLALGVTTTLTHVSCNGGHDGQIQVNATGGSPGYEYQLNAGIFQPGNVFSGLAAGTYSITVRDVNGCSTTISATLTQPNAGPLTITVDEILPVSCLNGSNGAIYISVSGCGPFTYSWYQNGNLISTAQDLVGIQGGSYSIFVVDGGGGTASLTNLVVATNTQTIDNLAVENNTSCAVTLKWSAKPNVDGYEVRWRACGSLVWMPTVAIGQVLQHTFTGLTANSCYDFSVRFDSEDCDGAWTNVNALTTPTYNPPINTSAVVNSNSSATISWQQAGCGGQAPNFVEVRYKPSTSMLWTVVNLPGTALNHTLNNLNPGATYQYRLRNRYIVSGVSKYSPYTATKTFTLPVLVVGNGGSDDRAEFDESIQVDYNIGENEEVELAGFANETGLKIALSPNPATDRTRLHLIRFDASNSLTVRLLSLSGQLLNEQILDDPTGATDLVLDIDELPQGIYLIEVLNGSERKTEKLVKQ